MSKIIELKGTKKGIISVVKLEEPYGKDSVTVASIAIALSGNPDASEWKVHIPVDNINEVIEALQEIKTNEA